MPILILLTFLSDINRLILLNYNAVILNKILVFKTFKRLGIILFYRKLVTQLRERCFHKFSRSSKNKGRFYQEYRALCYSLHKDCVELLLANKLSPKLVHNYFAIP